MKLGPKKRERLDGAAFAAFCGTARIPANELGCWRDCIAAVVDFMLSRQAEQVAPLLDAMRDAARVLDASDCPITTRKCREALAAYEAAQADEKEPTLAEAVEAMLRPGDGTIPIGGATLVDSCALAAVRAALAREKGGPK